jgi:hypothetical protein
MRQIQRGAERRIEQRLIRCGAETGGGVEYADAQIRDLASPRR